MLLPLMSPQLLKSAVSLSAIVGAANPEAMVLDSQVNRVHMTSDIGRADEGLRAAQPRTEGTLLDGVRL